MLKVMCYTAWLVCTAALHLLLAVCGQLVVLSCNLVVILAGVFPVHNTQLVSRLVG